MGDNFAVNFCTDKVCFVSGLSDGVNFEENEYANGHNSAHYTDRADCTAPEKISKTYENLLNGLAAQDPGW